MKLLKNNVHIRVLPTEDKTNEGIFRVSPVDNYSALLRADVINVGTEVTSVSNGDCVYVVPSAGFKVPGTDPVEKIVDLDNILAVL